MMRDTRHANCVPCLCHVSGLWCSARDGLICGHGHGEERVEAWIYWRERWHVQALMWCRSPAFGVGGAACQPELDRPRCTHVDRGRLAWRSRAAEFWLRVANFFSVRSSASNPRVSDNDAARDPTAGTHTFPRPPPNWPPRSGPGHRPLARRDGMHGSTADHRRRRAAVPSIWRALAPRHSRPPPSSSVPVVRASVTSR